MISLNWESKKKKSISGSKGNLRGKKFGEVYFEAIVFGLIMGPPCTDVLENPRRKELNSHKIITWETGLCQTMRLSCHHFRDGKQIFRQKMCTKSHRPWFKDQFEHRLECEMNRETCRLLTHPVWVISPAGCTAGTADHLEGELPLGQERIIAASAALLLFSVGLIMVKSQQVTYKWRSVPPNKSFLKPWIEWF